MKQPFTVMPYDWMVSIASRYRSNCFAFQFACPSRRLSGARAYVLRFERGQAFLAGIFPELEAELAGLQIGGKYEGPSRSPDRADACIWALTELSATRSGVPRVRML